MAPKPKKQKTAVPKYLCFSCGVLRSSSQFPDYNPTPDCEHLINTCRTCLKKWMQVKVDSGSFAVGGEEGKVFGVKCPQCDEIMRNANVEMAATKKIYGRFEELERNHIAESNPGWRWCLNPSCRAGQVHERKVHERKVHEISSSKRQKPRKKAESQRVPESDICVCHTCGAQACVTCDRPWHAEETCAEYQARIKDRVDEEDKSLKCIRTKTKACPNPNCRKRIEKNGGCPSMWCVACNTVFCWGCGEAFRDHLCACTRRPPAPLLPTES